LEEIPSSIDDLNALQEFDLSRCSNLEEIPLSIGDLNAFQEFYLLGVSI
jgi:Leucine-rich repeat (LRR) protein